MAPYAALYLGFVLSSLIEQVKLRPWALGGLFVALWLCLAYFAGLRAPTVGDDYENYRLIFELTRPLGDVVLRGEELALVREPLFLLWISATKAVGGGLESFIFLVALVATWFVFRGVNVMSPFPVLSLLLYLAHAYLNREMAQIQSGAAIAIGFYAVRFIPEKRPVAYHLTILAGSMIHVVAAVLLPLYYLTKIRVSNRFLIFLFFVALGLAAYDWVNPLLSILERRGLLPPTVSIYLAWEKFNRPLGVLTNLATLKQMVFFFLFLALRERLEAQFKYFRVSLLFYALSTYILISTHHFAILAARMATALSLVEILLLPMTLVVFRERRLAWFGVVVFAGMMLTLNLVLKGFLFDYSTIFSY